MMLENAYSHCRPFVEGLVTVPVAKLDGCGIVAFIGAVARTWSSQLRKTHGERQFPIIEIPTFIQDDTY